jgi:hypothetical protein
MQMFQTNILYPNSVIPPLEKMVVEPECFLDLNLNQVIGAITKDKDAYNLKPFFYTTLKELDTIYYRQAIFKDLENDCVLKTVKLFAENMVVMRRYLNLITRLYFKVHKQGWFLEATLSYCRALRELSKNLNGAPLKSDGLVNFRAYLEDYLTSQSFLTLEADTISTHEQLRAIQYNITIKDRTVRISKYNSELDYSLDVERIFNKFTQRGAEAPQIDKPSVGGMTHVEAQILENVAKLYPDAFQQLNLFCEKHLHFTDKTILDFDRGIQFYVSYLDFITPQKSKFLSYCYPTVSDKKDIFATNTFDIALADKHRLPYKPTITNDFHLENKERVFIVTGPNQGGKTTFARLFGQIHYLASLGCPVPGTKAKLFLFDDVYTHFEKEENLENLRGKLKDDLVRIHKILDDASPQSIIIMNEIFSSTTFKDALFLSKEVLKRIFQLDALAVCVTFIDELSTMSEQTVSMVSTVDPEDHTKRTYRIIRTPADGLAYAKHIAAKHRLSYQQIIERLQK